MEVNTERQFLSDMAELACRCAETAETHQEREYYREQELRWRERLANAKTEDAA